MNLNMRLFRRPPKVKPGGQLPPKNQWRYYVELERNQKISLKTADTATAQRLYRALKNEYLSKRLEVIQGRPQAKSLREFTEEYLDHSNKTKRHDTWRADRLALNKLMEYLGADTLLSAIGKKDLDRWIGDTAKDVKPRSVNVYLRHVKAAFSKAVEWGYLKGSPCKGTKELKPEKTPPRYLTKAEISQLLSAEKDLRFSQLWLFYLLTGCRRREALQLSCKDIDWRAGCIIVGKTKTHESKTVWITPELETLLRQLPEVGRWWPWHPDTVSHYFAKTAARAGIKARLHDLRHTYASYKAMAGVDLFTLKELLGHKDIKATQIYSHLSAAHLKEAARKGGLGID